MVKCGSTVLLLVKKKILRCTRVNKILSTSSLGKTVWVFDFISKLKSDREIELSKFLTYAN